VISDAALLIEGDRISDIGSTDEVLARHDRTNQIEIVDGRGWGVSPGFVDAHVHLSESLSRGYFPDDVGTRAWVFNWAKPFYAHVSKQDEAVGALVGTIEMLRCGTTCFLDMGSQWDAEGVALAVASVGIRGITGRHAADQRPDKIPPGWSPEMVDHHFFRDAQAALVALEETVRTWDGYANGRLRCWVNIEGKEPCSIELHVGARDLAERLGVGTTYHLATSIEEAHVSDRKYGMWPVTRVAHYGGLGPNLVLAHAVALKDDEIELLARHDTKVAFCPSTSLKLGKGATSIGKYPEMLDGGITVALGTDGVSASGNLNLHRQIHLAAGLFKDARLDATLVGARQALRMATIDGAKALNWAAEIGSLEKGKKGDFVLWDLDHHEWSPYDDPTLTLVWSASPASIAETWVDGRSVFAHGRVVDVDEQQVRSEARTRAREIVARAGLRRGETATTTNLYD
jgi:cytosine/adenosine deaminase-related metal-dependent hydrolase